MTRHAHLGPSLSAVAIVLLLVSLASVAGCAPEAPVESEVEDTSPVPAAVRPQDALSAFEVSVLASRESYPDGAETIVVATGHDWPDALGGSALAGVIGGPILFTATHEVPDIVAEEIVRLGASAAIVLGGEVALGPDVDADLKRLGLSVERIAGAGRYDTAERIARRVIEDLGDAYDGTAFVATGGSYADAVAAAPIAAARGWPIYLAHPTGGIVTYSEDAYEGVGSTIVLGGTNAVHPGAEAYLRNEFTVVRIAGQNRYDTSVRIAEYGVEEAGLAWERLGVATGEGFSDALAGGVLQGKVGGVLLLTPPESLSAYTSASLEANKADIATVTFFGGSDAISRTVRDAVAEILQ